MRQDFFSAMFLANLSALLKDAAMEKMTGCPGRKWEYKISITAVINVMRGRLALILYNPEERQGILDAMAEALKNKRSAIRPGRHAERKRPRVVKRHLLNHK